ncbi:hypothetical protein LX36DRAFT_130713 [Colletotrichum falcatum]|nr:hypothetical protein LX36DRAFT_130713 [Colletotrichum falcatum]
MDVVVVVESRGSEGPLGLGSALLDILLGTLRDTFCCLMWPKLYLFIAAGGQRGFVITGKRRRKKKQQIREACTVGRRGGKEKKKAVGTVSAE